MLALSFSGFDPYRKSAPGKCAPDRVQFRSCKGFGYQAFIGGMVKCPAGRQCGS